MPIVFRVSSPTNIIKGQLEGAPACSLCQKPIGFLWFRGFQNPEYLSLDSNALGKPPEYPLNTLRECLEYPSSGASASQARPPLCLRHRFHLLSEVCLVAKSPTTYQLIPTSKSSKVIVPGRVRPGSISSTTYKASKRSMVNSKTKPRRDKILKWKGREVRGAHRFPFLFLY